MQKLPACSALPANIRKTMVRQYRQGASIVPLGSILRNKEIGLEQIVFRARQASIRRPLVHQHTLAKTVVQGSTRLFAGLHRTMFA